MSINADITTALAPRLAEEGVDGLVAISPENFTYLARFMVPSHEPLRWRQAAVTQRADQTHSLLCVDMEETTVRAACPDSVFHVWEEFADNAMDVLVQGLHVGPGGAEVLSDVMDAERLHQVG